VEFYLSIPLSRFDEQIEELVRLQFNPEIRMTKADHLARMTADDFARIRELLEKHSLEVFTHGPFFGLDIASLDRCLSEYSADCLLIGLEATRSMGGKLMVMHTGYLPQFSRGGRRHWFRNWAERMPRIVDHAAKSGVTLALENTWDDRPDVLLHLADLLPQDSVKFCLDTGHINTFSRKDTDAWWDAIGDRVVALHLHDNDGLSDDHLAPGRGTFDFVRLFDRVALLEVQPLLDLEVDLESAEEGRAYIEALFPRG
jgi:sugar phosphate isomerase/epimerase